jgi:hypothetical protein
MHANHAETSKTAQSSARTEAKHIISLVVALHSHATAVLVHQLGSANILNIYSLTYMNE